MKKATRGVHPSRFVFCQKGESDFCPLSPVEKREISSILSQPFHFLDRGAQSFVFESKDGCYVLKIFQTNKHDRKFDFSGCALAYKEAREETAMVYAHLSPTRGEWPKVALTDPIGRRVSFEPDRYAFVLQRKVEPFEKTLFEADARGDLSLYLDAFFSLLKRRVSKGIWNDDLSLESNFGFLGQEAVEIDFGRYILRPGYPECEMDRFAKKLRQFIQLKLPHQLPLFEERVELCQKI
ncbi:MAG: hypothetical protein JSS32_04160 [Verrucomicrobia bacterium]|nr:hypothetical protein [Verrucomicrobiota bacterium]